MKLRLHHLRRRTYAFMNQTTKDPSQVPCHGSLQWLNRHRAILSLIERSHVSIEALDVDVVMTVTEKTIHIYKNSLVFPGHSRGTRDDFELLQSISRFGRS